MSKIFFTKIKWKNFLGGGNYWTSLNLNTQNITIITGINGSGKSIVQDAIFFALTGEPYRDINKPNLVNNINKKDCSVELEFTTNDKNYIIKRGIKPNFFQIWENEILLPEDGKRITYYQEKLNKITGLTPQLIRNLILISSNLKSFFNLQKNDKRNFNDDLFNLHIDKKFNLKHEDYDICCNDFHCVKSHNSSYSHIYIYVDDLKIKSMCQSSNESGLRNILYFLPTIFNDLCVWFIICSIILSVNSFVS